MAAFINSMRCLLVVMILTGSYDHAQSQNVADGVVEVYTGISTIGVGFVWPDQYHVVTALHVVAGRSNLRVRSYTPGQMGFIQVETVEKVLKEADLALLRLSSPLQVQPLRISSETPDINTYYTMYRTTPGGSRIGGFSKRLESGVETLDFFFNTGNPRLYKALNEQGYPQVRARIARVRDPVMKGDSGAPVCNQSGEVVGIIDGGLYNGLRAYNWAILASEHLPALNSSNNNESFASVRKTDPTLYLVTDNVEASKPLQFYNGKVSLQKVFTTTLDQINATLDLNQVERQEVEQQYARIAAETGKYIKNASIDVYQDWYTGATIAVPHGLTLEYSESNDQFLLLQATSPSGKVKMVFAIIDETSSDPGHDFIEYVLALDYEAYWEEEAFYPYEEEENYSAYDYYYNNEIGGGAAISLLYSYSDFMGLGAYIVDKISVSKEDEYYYELLQECAQLSDFPEY